MKNKKKQRERLSKTSFERPEEYWKPSKNGMETMNGNGVPKSVDKSNRKRSVNGASEQNSPRKKIKKNDSPKAKKTTSNVNGDSVSKESSGKNAISQLFSDHSRLLPGAKRQAMTKNYSSSTPYSPSQLETNIQVQSHRHFQSHESHPPLFRP